MNNKTFCLLKYSMNYVDINNNILTLPYELCRNKYNFVITQVQYGCKKKKKKLLSEARPTLY